LRSIRREIWTLDFACTGIPSVEMLSMPPEPPMRISNALNEPIVPRSMRFAELSPNCTP